MLVVARFLVIISFSIRKAAANKLAIVWRKKSAANSLQGGAKELC